MVPCHGFRIVSTDVLTCPSQRSGAVLVVNEERAMALCCPCTVGAGQRPFKYLPAFTTS